MRVLLVTPPMTQLNTPYPATAYLMGCLRKHAADAVRGGPGGSVDRAVPAAVLARRADSGAGRAEGGARPRRKKRFDWFLSRAADVRRAGRAGRAVSAGPRPQPGDAHRRTRVPARGSALRGARRRSGDESCSGGRSASSASPTAPATSPACSSTISPTSSVTASIPASSCRATARSSRRARPASIRSPTRSTRRRRWSTACSTSSRATASRAHAPTSSA